MTNNDFITLKTNPLLIASHNIGKAGEIIKQIEKVKNLIIKRASDFNLIAPDEPYDTFRENAAWKARYGMQQTGLITLADDSGMVIPSLNGAPGIHTADWFTNNKGERCFETGLERLNTALAGKDRTAYLVATLALVFPNNNCYFFEYQLQGTVLEKPKGSDGFGFDPIFQPQGYWETFAQMSPAQREKLSPRAQAARQLYEVLASQV